MSNKIIIIGGGASGLVAGIVAARNGSHVTILERMNRIGKKILATGNGKCNLTNTVYTQDSYRGQYPDFATNILEQFNVKDTLRFFNELGIYPKDVDGYIYPASEQASSVLDVLRLELEHLNVNIECDCEVIDVQKTNNGYMVKTNSKSYICDKVILSTGGMAAPELGSNGSGYSLAKRLGHTIIEPVPALVQLKAKGDFFKHLAGVRVEALITVWSENKEVTKEHGELQLTNYGVSGFPIFQLSRYVSRLLNNKKKVELSIDFMPNISKDMMHQILCDRFNNSPYKTLEESFIGLFNKKLGQILIKESGCDLNQPVNTINNKELIRLLDKIKNFRVQVTDTNTWSSAQVTAGGVSTTEIDNTTLESKKAQGLYLVGELIDIDGACGGYNLQWAWSTGYIAGINAYKKKDNR